MMQHVVGLKMMLKKSWMWWMENVDVEDWTQGDGGGRSCPRGGRRRGDAGDGAGVTSVIKVAGGRKKSEIQI